MESTFEHTLNTRVNTYLQQQARGRYASSMYWIKAFILIFTLVLLYIFILNLQVTPTIRLVLAIAFGLCSLLIVFNIAHDAIHGSLSPKPWLNILFGYTLNLVGGNARSWYLKHNMAHHQHTNIYGLDHDLEMEPLMRISPQAPYRTYYRYQHIYGLAFYTLFSLLIISYVDFLIFYQCRDKRYTLWQPWKEWLILILSKSLYLFYIIIIPVYFFDFHITSVLTAFLLMHLLNGLVIALVFQPSHYFVGTAHFGQSSQVSDLGWFRHHLMTTIDISPRSTILNLLLGGLNANIVHHLFPTICHQHFPALADIVEKTATEFGLPYQKATLVTAIRQHFAYLKAMGETKELLNA